MKRCQELIAWYEQAKRRHRRAYQSFQAAAIILSGLTLVLFLWSDLHEVLKALPGVLTAIATGLAGVFQWRESYECFACVVEALKSERLKFETRTTAEYSLELDEHQALSNFVARMEAPHEVRVQES